MKKFAPKVLFGRRSRILEFVVHAICDRGKNFKATLQWYVIPLPVILSFCVLFPEQGTWIAIGGAFVWVAISIIAKHKVDHS